jgi:hypothetical protein
MPTVCQSESATSSHATSMHTVVRPCHVSLYGLYSQRPFFACLTFRTDCDISRSRRPFEMKRVALGLQRRGLRSRRFEVIPSTLNF